MVSSTIVFSVIYFYFSPSIEILVTSAEDEVKMFQRTSLKSPTQNLSNSSLLLLRYAMYVVLKFSKLTKCVGDILIKATQKQKISE